MLTTITVIKPRLKHLASPRPPVAMVTPFLFMPIAAVAAVPAMIVITDVTDGITVSGGVGTSCLADSYGIHDLEEIEVKKRIIFNGATVPEFLEHASVATSM